MKKPFLNALTDLLTHGGVEAHVVIARMEDGTVHIASNPEIGPVELRDLLSFYAEMIHADLAHTRGLCH